jgi:hypothetical protein
MHQFFVRLSHNEQKPGHGNNKAHSVIFASLRGGKNSRRQVGREFFQTDIEENERDDLGCSPARA